VVPFGLKNAPPFFQRIMDQTVVGKKHCARCSIDDVIILLRNLEIGGKCLGVCEIRESSVTDQR
jgi:hypothetical protein